MPSTPTCTLSRVMQIWAGMSSACSFNEWRYRITTTNSTTKAIRTRTNSVPGKTMASTRTSLRTKIEHQTLDGDDAAPLSDGERDGVDVPRAPGGSAQLGATMCARCDRLRGCGNFPNQRVDVGAIAAHPQPIQDRPAEHSQRDERENREEEPLHPRRSRDPGKRQQADDEGGDTKEDDEDAAGRRQFERGQTEAENDPE